MTAQDPRLEQYLAAHPDCGMLELLIADMVGVLRGKRVLPEEFAKVFSKGFNIPGSVVMLDSMGAVIDGLPYGADDGDPDVYARPIPETLAPIPWARRDCAQVLFSLAEFVLVALVVFQFVSTLIAGRRNAQLLQFGNQLSTWLYRVLQFVTFTTDRRPWPFDAWPTPPTPALTREEEAR